MELAARNFIVASIQENDPPAKIARGLVGVVNRATGQREGGIIGLTSVQEQWQRNYAAEIASTDPQNLRSALQRGLRDNRFDRTIAKAIASGEPIPADMRAKMITAYRNASLKLRGETIAKNESITALRAGRHEGFKQVLDTGTVTEDQIERTWDATGDARTRPDHLLMEGQMVKGFSRPFVAPDGSQMMFPGDTSLGASAKETINCRCYEQIRIRYIR